MAQRYFVDPLPATGPARLDGDLAHHLGTVLRAAPGDELRLGDGRGGAAVAVVRSVQRGRIDVDVLAVQQQPPPQLVVHVAFALARLPRVDWLFEHGTEVGVSGFFPLWTSRTRPGGERVDRWRKLVLAAAGQCDRLFVPEVHAPMALEQFLAGPLPERRFVAAKDAPRLSAPAAGAAVLLVGPEGGLTDTEQAAAVASGFVPVGLGPFTLRTETAALVGAALLLAGAAAQA